MANGRINKPAGRNSNTSKQEVVVRTDRPIVVDATNHIAGRLSSNVAKLLLQGHRVTVINCEKIMMSGTRSNQIQEYREFLENFLDTKLIIKKVVMPSNNEKVLIEIV